MTSLDPVELALLQNRLDHVARQMGQVMVRTARSPIFNQSHDFSCFITDAAGRLISQADGIPIHTGGGGFAVRAVLEAFSDAIGPDDVFLLNDPYVAGGNHLPDWTLVRPVFVDDRHVAFACNRAHQSDIGGGAAGTYNSAATEIFHEGLRLPPMRLIENGRTREDLWRLLLLNSRTPHYLDGDLRAMVGSTGVGADLIARRLGALPVDISLAYLEGILDHAERRVRAAIRRLPDGCYEGRDAFDDDCFEPADLPILVRLRIQGDDLEVDFSGTAPQIRGFKNSSLANTHSAVYMALATFLDADIPRNEGTFRAVRINAPEGSLVNARAPAPMTMNTVFPAHQIIQACWRALAAVDPDRACAGWGPNAFPTMSGQDAEGRTYVVYHWGGNSGAGAVKGRDGFNQLGPMITLGGLVIPDAEMQERLFPVRVLRQEFRRDSAGAGEYRGGTGIDYVVRCPENAEFSFRTEGVVRSRSFGCNGGTAGAPGSVQVHTASGEETPPGYGMRRYPECTLRILSPAGGGWGDPLERDATAVARDVRDGLLSPARARDDYAVVVSATGTLDETASLEARRRRRTATRG